MEIRACLFDVFGTLVDWRTSVARDCETFARSKGIQGVDWTAFAVEWRRLYQPSMEEVRSGRRAWTILDVLHRPEHYADIVMGIREEFRRKHTPEARLRELVGFIEE